jgi:hypothetical protein
LVRLDHHDVEHLCRKMMRFIVAEVCTTTVIGSLVGYERPDER